MRIGIVSEYYRPWPGGISEHVHHEAAELVARGHEVSILTGPAGESGTVGDRDAGAEVLRFGREIFLTDNGAASRLVVGPFLFGLRRRFERMGLDVVHVHAPMDPFLAWAAVSFAPCATVGTFHANLVPSRLWDTLFGTLRPLTQRIFDRLDERIAVSPAAREAIRHYFPADFQIIPNGVDLARFHPEAHCGLDLGADGPRILFVGRADPRKGLPHLLAAFAQIQARIPAAQLVIAGPRDEELTALLAEIPDAARERVRSLGYVAADEMPGLFAACDVFCSPATGQESQGIVLLEAMAAGRPPVAFDIPGYRDVVSHGHDGWLVPEIGAPPLADAIVHLLSRPEARAAMGDAGRKTALGYAWPAVVERLEARFDAARRHFADSRGSGSPSRG